MIEILFWLDTPYEKDQKVEKVKHLILINSKNNISDIPLTILRNKIYLAKY